jgi:hypothetical protein
VGCGATLVGKPDVVRVTLEDWRVGAGTGATERVGFVGVAAVLVLRMERVGEVDSARDLGSEKPG